MSTRQIIADPADGARLDGGGLGLRLRSSFMLSAVSIGIRPGIAVVFTSRGKSFARLILSTWRFLPVSGWFSGWEEIEVIAKDGKWKLLADHGVERLRDVQPQLIKLLPSSCFRSTMSRITTIKAAGPQTRLEPHLDVGDAYNFQNHVTGRSQLAWIKGKCRTQESVRLNQQLGPDVSTAVFLAVVEGHEKFLSAKTLATRPGDRYAL
ncbi:hypothetical protein NEUTE1DRAFT_108790 [Neurospora tetrasperma FGSC 2508]|uniref:Uncharacterized protein n=1 Tax=Neurospora tetrasperma (strain FGSC 2508 / ATCC MYA-4615 / P0657) TaxID=510951 RepID=F8MFM4_NEUT8|nr:uncharacterized protein NEUTE1DRAFT_108790 [Neurospora tetrasperma FGSC 2508]EGO59250.1 hypothetical protein NEUTE1DRAFT_108790 [Neurospora tetrasperma FGSC 2508]EGZ73366.1 hypothetical protein NEUTE2DRAFT_137719 [Neurospora tetrasperma FGSC 2509]